MASTCKDAIAFEYSITKRVWQTVSPCPVRAALPSKLSPILMWCRNDYKRSVGRGDWPTIDLLVFYRFSVLKISPFVALVPLWTDLILVGSSCFAWEDVEAEVEVKFKAGFEVEVGVKAMYYVRSELQAQ